jgi:deazaflavin-dependent oxidoreductase (nitroreductase family)
MRILTPLAVRIGRISWMPRYLPQIVRIDAVLERATRGRVSVLGIGGLPNAVLTVVGRRSGELRRSPLLAAPTECGWLIAGSHFGGSTEPQWVKNLAAAGAGTLTVKGHEQAVEARQLFGAERAAAWRRLVGVWPNFGVYEQRTDREIPVFELRRVDATIERREAAVSR